LARSKSRVRKREKPAASIRRLHLPWIAIGITLALLVTAAFAVDPIRDAATHTVVGEATLATPSSYLVIEPLSSSLDTLTLLTVGQHIALILWAIGIFVFIRVYRAHTRETNPKREGVATALFFIGLFVVYAAMAMLPRPMAGLATSDNTVVVLDFHSHTKYSHDGRAGWNEDDVRKWYRGAGVNVAYVTDHATFEGAERAVSSNPGQAGEETTLLQGIEAFYKGEHVNVLSAGRRFRGLLDATMKDVDPEALALASIIPATAPTLIETIPGNLSKVRSIAASDSTAGVSAIEIVDGSPRGLSQTRGKREQIVALADSLNLALVTGSDNHGYGHAAAGWTLMRIPGWRGMPTDSISRRIEDVLRIGRRESTRAVERTVAGSNPIEILFAAPVIVWRMFTTLSGDERVAWIIWVWAIVVVARGARRLRLRPSQAA
jgi:predicted metal-dependent phosphoesterase TrpH